MGLFEPIWKKRNLNGKQHEKALRAIAKETDQEKLCEIACTVTDDDLREAAFANLHSRDALIRVAARAPRNGKQREKVLRAIAKETDQEKLCEIACTVTDDDLREAALANLHSRDALIRVAARAPRRLTSSHDYSYNIAALDKLDQEDIGAFEAVVEASKIEPVLLEAARRAGNSPVANGFLVDTFLGKSDLYLRLEADGKRLARSYSEELKAQHKMTDLRVRAAEAMCDEARCDEAVQSELVKIVQDTSRHMTWTREGAAGLLADAGLARQYRIASRLVGLGADHAGPRNADACSEITDPEVIDFFLQHFSSAGGQLDVARTALSNVYSNIDPNSERAFEVLSRKPCLRGWVKGKSEYAEVLELPEWELLKRVSDQDMLKRLAKSEGAPRFVRFRACEMAGGHDLSGANCACAICGFEDHRFTEGACERCGSKLVHTVYGGGDLWTTSEQIEHPDGTVACIASWHWQHVGVV